MNSGQRVLYLSRGLSTHDQRFLTSLAETDYEVTFLRLENKLNHIDLNSLPGKIEILPPLHPKNDFRFFSLLKDLRKLKSIINQVNPDIIHAGPIQTCAFLAALTGFRNLVSMSWGSDILVDSEKNLLYKLITTYTLNRTAYLLGDCNAVTNKAIQFGFPKERIVTFPWGIDLLKFQPGENSELRNQLGWNDKFIILSLRSWEKIYGVEMVVNAFYEAVQQRPDLRLLLLGTGSLKAEIEKIIVEKDLESLVYLGGVIDQQNLPDYYHGADLYISASYSDGSSVSLMEALGSGLPVLVSDIPGNKEWIDHGYNGWLFKSGSVEDLTQSLLELYERRTKLSNIRLAARITAEDRANWQKNFQNLLRAYQMALNSSRH